MITVIITTYKGSNFLSRAIDSVLAQKDTNFEIIVVDDNQPGTEDRKKTEEVMKQYASNRAVKYIKHPKNMNGSVARNTGIKQARGEYISFLDDDDFYMPDRLKKCRSVLNKENVDIVYTDTLVMSGSVPVSYVRAYKSGNLFNDLLTNDALFGTGSNLFLKKSLIEEFGNFNEKLRRHQDYEFLLRMFNNGAIAMPISECLVVKATNGNSNWPNYNTLKEIKDELYIEFKEKINSLPKDLQISCEIYQHRQLMNTAFENHDIANAKKEAKNLKKMGDKSAKLYLVVRLATEKTHIFPVLQKLKHRLSSNRIIKEHTREYNWAKQFVY